MHTMHVDLLELTNSSPSICRFPHVHEVAQTVGKQIRNWLYQGELLRERLFLSFVFILKQTFKILLTPDDSLTIEAFLFVCLFLFTEGVGSCICPAVEPACRFRQGEKEIKEEEKKKKALGQVLIYKSKELQPSGILTEWINYPPVAPSFFLICKVNCWPALQVFIVKTQRFLSAEHAVCLLHLKQKSRTASLSVQITEHYQRWSKLAVFSYTKLLLNFKGFCARTVGSASYLHSVLTR